MTNHYSEYINYWNLDRDMIFLNHGSFGACPKPILDLQQTYRNQLESQPLRFMVRELEEPMYTSKTILADFVGCKSSDLVFVRNATSGVNTILRSINFNAGDEIIITNHIYPACRNAVNFIRDKYGVKICEAVIPFNLDSEQEILEALLEQKSRNTRLVIIDHITSPTGILFPVEEIVSRFREYDIETLVDGAHAPGTVPLNIEKIGAAYYTGNCHKWICSPKGSAFLYVHPDFQEKIDPLTISLISGKDKCFEERFYWQGTEDPSPFLCVGESIRFMENIFPGGWDGIMKHNHDLAIHARSLFCKQGIGSEACPDFMIANLASMKLPDSKGKAPDRFNQVDSLQEKLYREYKIEVFITYWPAFPKRLIRVSPQIYNSIEQYNYLAEVISNLL